MMMMMTTTTTITTTTLTWFDFHFNVSLLLCKISYDSETKTKIKTEPIMKPNQKIYASVVVSGHLIAAYMNHRLNLQSTTTTRKNKQVQLP